MTTYQSQSNGYVAYKVQSALGTGASGSGGTILRQAGGQGGRLTKAATESNEVRRDGMRTRGRHGTQKTAGEWAAEMSIGSHEDIIEAIMRDTWSAADLTITEATASLTSITTTAHTIVAGGGSWITAGVMVGDVWRLTNHATAANNGKNLRITGVTTSTLTVAETLVVDAAPDASFTLTRPGSKIIQYSANSLVKRYFTIEEVDLDLDQSELMTDFVWGSLRFSMAPNGLLMADPGGIGTGQFRAIGTDSPSDVPWLTSPSESTAAPLAVVDATIRVNGEDVVDLTSFDLSLDIGPVAPDVFGSGAIKYSPDVFSGQMAVAMNITALRKDLQFVQDFIDETVYELHVLAVENESEPKDFISIFVPNFTLGSVDKSALSKEGGARTQTIAIPAALVGKDESGSGRDATMIKIQSTG
jgi:hypothetical protein